MLGSPLSALMSQANLELHAKQIFDANRVIRGSRGPLDLPLLRVGCCLAFTRTTLQIN